MSRGRQRGQALPLGLALALLGTVGAFVLYNVGQATADKTRLANAADAAAYSGALWQARALNFQAYTNRASVANEVSIAQAVSLRSWAKYGAISSENVNTVLGAIPFIGSITNTIEQVMNGVATVLEPVADAAVTVIDIVNAGISTSQEAMFASTFLATPEIVRTVAEGSDGSGRFTVETAYTLAGLYNNLGGWNEFTDSVDAGESGHAVMTHRVDMINASRDPFSSERNWKFLRVAFPLTPLTWVKIVREGETRLVPVTGADGRPSWEWKAKDTVALQTKILRPFRSTKRREDPIGWAQAYANDAAEGRSLEDDCRYGLGRTCDYWLGRNRKSEDWARDDVPSLRGQRPSVHMSGYNGLHAFRTLSDSVKDGMASGAERPALRLKVEVAMPIERARTTDAFDVGEPFDSDVVAPGSRLSSIGIAEVYYQRPQPTAKAAMPTERANGYNPYWDVRLSPVSAEERLLALALRPGGGGAGAVVPGFAGAGGTVEVGGDHALPDYVDTLAGAYGDARGDTDAIRGGIDRVRGLPGDLAGVGREFAGELDERFRTADGIAGVFRDELEDKMRDAAKDILAGMVRNAVNSATGQRIVEVVGDVDAQAQEARAWAEDQVAAFDTGVANNPITEAFDAAATQGERLESHFREIGPRIVDEFEVVMTEAVAQARADMRAVDAEIRDLQRQRSSGNADRSDLDARIVAAQTRRDALWTSMKATLAQSFVDIVADHTTLWVAPPSIARDFVEDALADPDGLVEDSLPWENDDDG